MITKTFIVSSEVGIITQLNVQTDHKLYQL